MRYINGSYDRQGFGAQDFALVDGGMNNIRELALMNAGLIRDEGSENPMNVEQLAERMAGFLKSGYIAKLVMIGRVTAGYCLYRMDNRIDGRGYDCFIRHFYIKPRFRNRGIGTEVFKRLSENCFNKAVEIKVEVLESNPAGKAFWAKLGFVPYSYSLRKKL